MDDEELVDFELAVTYEVGLELPLSLNVTATDIDFLLWLDVPGKEGEEVGKLLLSVPFL